MIHRLKFYQSIHRASMIRRLTSATGSSLNFFLFCHSKKHTPLDIMGVTWGDRFNLSKLVLWWWWVFSGSLIVHPWFGSLSDNVVVIPVSLWMDWPTKRLSYLWWIKIQKSIIIFMMNILFGVYVKGIVIQTSFKEKCLNILMMMLILRN